MSNTYTWYTIEKGIGGYTVWFNKETIYEDRGGYGSLGLFTSLYKKDCIEYCKKRHIKYERKNV